MTKEKSKFNVEKVRELILEYRETDDWQEKDRIEQEVLDATVNRHYHTFDDGTAFEDADDEKLFWAYLDTEAKMRKENLASELDERGFSISFTTADRKRVEQLVDQHGVEFFRGDS